jgi:AcrR family transcriptional regulator
MGRKNRSAERREEIITAFCDCVVELGLAQASMGEVASRLGMDRSTMHYYFRTREELVVAATERISRFYVDLIEQRVAKFEPAIAARQLIEFLFGPTFHQPRLSVILIELRALGNREPFFKEQVYTIYRRIENVCISVLDKSFPRASAKNRRMVAYAIGQLAEGATIEMSLGFDRSRSVAARAAALLLIRQLE